MSKVHHLKVWPMYYGRLKTGHKTFEIRKNDRDFQTGDLLILKEYDPESGQYTEEWMERKIGYVLQGGQFGLEVGYCALSLIKDK